MATLRPAPFRQRQEEGVPVSPAGRDGENANAPANWEHDCLHSRKRPLRPPEETESLLNPTERIENAPQIAPGDRFGQGQPQRRWDKSRPDMRRPRWDRRMGNGSAGERQRPYVNERSTVWRPGTRPLSQSYNYPLQGSREVPTRSPEKGDHTVCSHHQRSSKTTPTLVDFNGVMFT
jgi:hypothetical protein